MPVKIEDFAKHPELSISAVSRAINGYSDISSAKRTCVQIAARAMRYHPGTAAQGLHRRQTNKIGLVSNFPVSALAEFLAQLIVWVTLVAKQMEGKTVLYTTIDHLVEQLNNICRAREVDGLLLPWTWPDIPILSKHTAHYTPGFEVKSPRQVFS